MEDKRTEDRIITQVLGNVKKINSHQWGKGLFVDVGMGGGCVFVSEQLEPSTLLEVNIQLGRVYVAGTVVVKWSKPVREQRVWATGFSFVDTKLSDLKHFIDYAGALQL